MDYFSNFHAGNVNHKLLQTQSLLHNYKLVNH